MAIITLGLSVVPSGDVKILDQIPPKLDNIDKGAKKAGASLAGMGNNIQTMATGQLESRLGPLEGLFSGISGGALAAGAGIGALATAAGAASSAMADAVMQFASFSGHLMDLSAATGIGTTALQELSYAGSFTGIGLDTTTAAIERMQKAIADGDSIFKRLGLSLAEVRTMKPEDQFSKVAEAINAIQDPARRTAAAMELFGKSGAGMLPMLGDLEKLREEAHKFGAVVDSDLVKKGVQLNDAFNRLAQAATGLKLSLGTIAVDTGLVKFFEMLAYWVGQTASNLPELIRLAKEAVGIGGGNPNVNPAVASAAARAALSTSVKPPPTGIGGFETAAEEKAKEAAAQKAETAAKQFAEALKQARLEAFELQTQIEQVGDAGMESFGNILAGLAMKTTNALGQTALDLSSVSEQVQHLLALPEPTITVPDDVMAAAVARQHELERAIHDKAAADLKAAQAALAHREALENLANTLAGVAQILGDVGGLMGAFGISADSGIGKAVGALQGMAGAAADFVGAMASGNIAGMVSAGIRGVTSLVKGIKGIFGKSDAQKAGEIAGRVLGTSISKGLAETISKMAKELGIAKEAASLLNLGAAMDESGKSAVSFSGQMNSLLEGIALGSVPAEKGIQAMGDAFSKLVTEADAGSVAAMASMGALANRAKQLGIAVPEITAAVKDAAAASMGATGALGGIKVVSEADAKAQAQIFLNVFNSTLASEGIVAAAQAIQPAIKTFREQLSEAGIGKGAADAILGPINSAMSLLKNDMTKGGAEGAQALKTILESQLKAGFLDVNTFGAIQEQAKTAFDQMVKGGADTQAAFQAIAPLLAQIQQTAAATGTAVDSQTQALIDSAKASGVAFPISPMERMVELMEVMVQGMGFQVPAAAQQTTTAIGGISSATAAAAAGASSSLSTISSAAIGTSSTVVAAFDGVGTQIMTAITPAAGAIEGQLTAAFDAGIGQAQQLATFLGKLDNTTLTIPFTFQGQGGGPSGFGGGFGPRIPEFQHGGFLPEKSGGHIVSVAGRGTGGEYMLPANQIGSINSSPTIIVQGAQDPYATAQAIKDVLENNMGGTVSKVKRVLSGRR